MPCDSRVHAKQLLVRAGCGSGMQGFRDCWDTDERMADLQDSEKVSRLALVSFPDLSCRGGTMNPAFDILKKIGAVNFEWVETVQDLQPAEARIQELLARSPGEYVVFSQRTQEIVGRFNSLMAGSGET